MDDVAQADDGYERFCKELEMVQALAYPSYLHQLAKHSILEQPEFVEYLRYLQYWREPEYARFVVYPLSLHMLDLLQEPTFRANMKNEQLVAQMGEHLLRQWATWRNPAVTMSTLSAREPPSTHERPISVGACLALRDLLLRLCKLLTERTATARRLFGLQCTASRVFEHALSPYAQIFKLFTGDLGVLESEETIGFLLASHALGWLL